MLRNRLSADYKEDIYKAYKHGVSVPSILRDFNISLEKFKKTMNEIGGPDFHPMLFNKFGYILADDVFDGKAKWAKSKVDKFKKIYEKEDLIFWG